mgnify:CR=1 FL=1|jgi:hypothetical protein
MNKRIIYFGLLLLVMIPLVSATTIVLHFYCNMVKDKNFIFFPLNHSSLC